MDKVLPVGKLPFDLMAQIIEQAPISDSRVMLGPGIGLDCAVVDMGTTLLVFKSDPITFATDEIGWYAVQINANDIATTGAAPRWMLATLLLPEGSTTPQDVLKMGGQVFSACRELGISLIGGHTEVTHGLERPILSGVLVGEVPHGQLVTPRGASVGDHILLTKGVPIEATSILAREFPGRLKNILSDEEMKQAADYLYQPGISVVKDARVAVSAGRVTAMHDPTEGGLASALWELADASARALEVDLAAVPVPALSQRICQYLGLNPMATIASGALLLTCPPDDSAQICRALQTESIPCARIGVVREGPAVVYNRVNNTREILHRPLRDEIAKVYDS